MINQKYQKALHSFFTALIMSGIMSLVISIINLGLVDNIIFIWLSAWKFAFIIAFPVVSIVSPIVNKIVRFLVRA